MSENILVRMSIQKSKMIQEIIREFVGHEPSAEERKEFKIMHQLDESLIYHKGKLIAQVKHGVDDEGFVS